MKLKKFIEGKFFEKKCGCVPQKRGRKLDKK